MAVPVPTPDTKPVPDTVAIEVPELLHVPPPGLHVRAVVPPSHSTAVPPITPVAAFTVTILVL